MSDDTIAINVGQWTQTNAEFTDAAAEESWANDDGLGVVAHAAGGARRRRRARRRGARVRYSVLLGSPCAAGRPSRRRRSDSGATRDGAVDAGGDRPRVPLVEAPRRGGAARRFELRSRRLRSTAPRLGRPLQMDSEAARPAPPGRARRLSDELDACAPVPARRRTSRLRSVLQRELFGMWRTKWPNYPASSTTSRTASGSGSCARAGLRSTRCTSCGRETTPSTTRTTTLIRSSGPAAWPAEEIWEAHLR